MTLNLFFYHKKIISQQQNSMEASKPVSRRFSIQPFTLAKVKDSKKFTFGKSLWLVWVLLFRAATVVSHPSGFASKFLANIWACLCLAFTASYTANLAAFMIIREDYPDLKGIEDSVVSLFIFSIFYHTYFRARFSNW